MIRWNRRHFLGGAATVLAPIANAGTLLAGEVSAPKPIRVLVWDEQQPAQKAAYPDFLGGSIARHLRTQEGISVRSVKLDDPQQGLGPGVLEETDALIWWGHVRQAEVAPEVGRRIVSRIKTGKLGLIAVHSAHWSTPFMEAMNERSREDALRQARVGGDERVEIREVPPPRRSTVPTREERPTPYSAVKKTPAGVTTVTLHLPYCCFPAYRNDGKPSHVRVLRPEHPIATGIPRTFEIPQTEMYDEPFHVPAPDEVVLEERWASSGEWFRSGSVWNLGRGKVFYFRPGHETYPIFEQEIPLRILTNAVRWMAVRPG